VSGTEGHGGIVDIVPSCELEMKLVAVEGEATSTGIRLEDLIAGGGLWA
jgi:hypothetical protein